jgi:ribosome-binding protein aMBF1 (putative translation factor)
VKKTRDFGEVIRAMLAENPELAEAVEKETIDANIAAQIYRARKAARISQTELARRVGTTQSVISRIEDADYDGHSLTMLKRIAAALGQQLKVEFCGNAPVAP